MVPTLLQYALCYLCRSKYAGKTPMDILFHELLHSSVNQYTVRVLTGRSGDDGSSSPFWEGFFVFLLCDVRFFLRSCGGTEFLRRSSILGRSVSPSVGRSGISGGTQSGSKLASLAGLVKSLRACRSSGVIDSLILRNSLLVMVSQDFPPK